MIKEHYEKFFAGIARINAQMEQRAIDQKSVDKIIRDHNTTSPLKYLTEEEFDRLIGYSRPKEYSDKDENFEYQDLDKY